MNKYKIIKSIGTWCVAKATHETMTGNYIIDASEIVDVFGITMDQFNMYIDEIIEEIMNYHCVSDVVKELDPDTLEFSLDINLFTDYCFYDVE